MRINPWVATITLIAVLLIGGIAGVILFPKTITETKTIRVPTEVIVEKSVPGPEIEVPLDAKTTYLDAAVDDFLSEIEDKERLQSCGKEEYDADQIAIKKIYNDWAIAFGTDRNDEEQSAVDFTAKLKYLDSDVEEKCYKTCDVSVLYRIDKDPKVSVSCR